jgi:hypothetical protein
MDDSSIKTWLGMAVAIAPAAPFFLRRSSQPPIAGTAAIVEPARQDRARAAAFDVREYRIAPAARFATAGWRWRSSRFREDNGAESADTTRVESAEVEIRRRR